MARQQETFLETAPDNKVGSYYRPPTLTSYFWPVVVIAARGKRRGAKEPTRKSPPLLFPLSRDAAEL